MPVLVTCKFDEEPIKIEGTIEYRLFHHSMAIKSEMNSPIWPSIGFIRDVMAVLVTCKFHEDAIKTEVAIIRTTFKDSTISLWKNLSSLKHK